MNEELSVQAERGVMFYPELGRAFGMTGALYVQHPPRKKIDFSDILPPEFRQNPVENPAEDSPNA